MDRWTIIIGLVIIGLIGGNVYQWQNPNVVEIPVGQERIDSTSWVRQSTVLSQRAIIDSLENQNQALAERVKEQQDQIASYTTITGRLKTQVDSLQHQEPAWNAIPLVDQMQRRDSVAIMDTTFHRSETFGGGLFRVDGYVDLRYRPDIGFQVRQDFELNQIRDIRLDVAHTISEDNARSLVYVTSPDFESLKYKTSTALKPENELPWFWIGLGAGFAGGLFLL